MEKFEKKFQIRSYECDQDGFLRVVTLMNILQDAADLSATSLGFGFNFCLSTGVTWMGTNYHIKIKRLPKIHEHIIIKTWPSGENKFMATRDFAIYDEKNAEIIKATSQWVLIDIARKRPVSLDQYLPQYMYIDERVLGTDFAKLPDIENAEFQKTFEARYDDIDINRHVNNSIYPLWAVETLPEEFHGKYEPAEIEISYKKECLCGEVVLASATLKDMTSIHTISAADGSKECARLRIVWQNKI